MVFVPHNCPLHYHLRSAEDDTLVWWLLRMRSLLLPTASVTRLLGMLAFESRNRSGYEGWTR